MTAGRTALVLGSGLRQLFAAPSGLKLSGGEVRTTPFGPSRPVFEATLAGGRTALCLARHGEGGYDIGAGSVNYRANLWALKDLGADTVLAVSSCGGVDPRLGVGTFVVPHDILDRTTRRAKTFFEGTGHGCLRHDQPFCPAVRAAWADALAEVGARHRLGGVYVCMDGPRLETPAEIRALAAEGATLVGMTVAPEFALARELELCYAPLCWVVNPAEGVGTGAYRADSTYQGMVSEEDQAEAKRAVARLPEILAAALRRIVPERTCHCRQAMGSARDAWRTPAPR